MSKASREYKKQYGTTLYEYRRERRLMQREDREVEKAFCEMDNFHRRFYIESPWIPVEERRSYRFSPEFWDWCYNRIKKYKKHKEIRDVGRQ